MSAGGETPGSDPEALSASVSHHVRSLFAAAERSAAAIRGEAEERAAMIVERAEADARRITHEARTEADALLAARRRELAALSDQVVAAGRAALEDLQSMATTRAALEGLTRSLRETAERLGQAPPASAPPPPIASQPQPPLRPAPEPAGGDGDGSAGAAPNGAARDGDATASIASGEPEPPRGLTGARLVAFQMAQAGSTRGEVAAHLRRTFAVADVNEVLNEAFPAPGR